MLSRSSFGGTFFERVRLFGTGTGLSSCFSLGHECVGASSVVLFRSSAVGLSVMPGRFFGRTVRTLCAATFRSYSLLYCGYSLTSVSCTLIFGRRRVISDLGVRLSRSVDGVSRTCVIIRGGHCREFGTLMSQGFSSRGLVSLLGGFSGQRSTSVGDVIASGTSVPAVFRCVLKVV